MLTFVAAIAAVLSNWHTVLRAIHMASGTVSAIPSLSVLLLTSYRIAHIPQPKTAEWDNETQGDVPLPQTLVRIPLQDVQPQREDHQNEQDPAIVK